LELLQAMTAGAEVCNTYRYRCVECGYECKELYHSYCGGVVKLMHCVSTLTNYNICCIAFSFQPMTERFKSHSKCWRLRKCSGCTECKVVRDYQKALRYEDIIRMQHTDECSDVNLLRQNFNAIQIGVRCGVVKWEAFMGLADYNQMILPKHYLI